MQRQLEQKRKQRRTRMLMWSTGAAFVALIVLAAIFKPSSKLDLQYDTLPLNGKADAPVKIVEFGDFKCPSCKLFSESILPQLQKDFIDKGDVGFYFANFTIIGPDSNTAALAGQSIFHQNKDEFWNFYHKIYANQGNENVQWATPDFLTDFVKQQGIKVDADKVHQDIVNGTYQKEVTAQINLGKKGNVNATPTLFINGEIFTDVFNYGHLKSAIEAAMAK